MKKSNKKNMRERFFDLKRDKSVTMKMIGEKAGVHTSTVMRVINSRNVRFIESTQGAILSAIEHFEGLKFSEIHGGLKVKRAAYGSKKGVV